MQNHWRHTLTAAAILAVVLSGCGQAKPLNGTQPNQTAEQPAHQTEQGQTSGGGSNSQAPAAASEQSKISKVIKTYYSDAEFTKLVEQQAKIEFKNEADQYLTALNQLKKTPDDTTISLCKEISFKSAVLKDGQVTVDLSLPDAARLGSPGEEMLLDALKKTLFQFSEVKTIEILLDGKQVESLMGHMELPHPIKR
ncbi:GerMN domain-containing protein [Paenibacillus validus]|uniref:GerMN domain-containing protein n=1 Tax=Paenibacillus validus TaxID=44253 RepID=A0A7X3CU50_9BACL|nr:GerMN domain-containing protein [Paenibacillus validus]MUG71772.1 hypothetical protein [Paenibacillus validus]